MAESPVIYLLGKLASFFENEFQHMRQGREEMIVLRGEFERIKAFLRVADSMEESNEEVKVWIKQIREVAYDAEDALDEFKLLLAHDHEGRGLLYKIPCCIRNMKARYQLTAAIKSISCRMKDICESHQRLSEKSNRDQEGSSSTCEDDTWQDHRADAVFVEKSGLVGIEEPKKKLTQWLVDGISEREVISVVGMGGLGKTTLVKQVFDDPVVKKHFPVRAWVTLSPSSKTEELLMDMLQQIASTIMKPVPSGADTMNIDWLKMMIKSFLQGRRSRYLIVLDDVWHMDKWDAVKYALPNNNRGSRIMITTRNGELAQASCTEFDGQVYEMQPLPVEQSWKLFCRKTFKKNLCPSHLQDICTDILKKCEGLPLAIVAISGVLATKDKRRIEEWDLVRRCLRSEIDGNDKLKNMKKVLSLSFNDLPYYLKSCLLQTSIFPEAHIIERMRLTRQWVAEGFVEMKDAKTMEEVADGYLNELVYRSLIHVVERDKDGRVKSYRIHGLLRKIIISKSRDQNFAAIVDEQSSAWPDRIRRCSIHNELQIGQQNLSLSHLRSLYVFGVDKFSLYRILSGDLKLLSVLDLQNAPLRRLPVQVVDMRCLKFLSLRHTQIQTVPTFIGRLQNLETLDLKHTYVTSLPVEIMKLQRLCHLLVYRYQTVSYTHYKHGFSTPAHIGALQSLQKLCYIDAEDDRTNNVISELGKLNQLRRLCILKLKKEDGRKLCWSIAKLTNLQALAVSSLRDDEDIDLQYLSSPPPLLQRIYLRGRMQALPHWIANMHSLVKLHLRWCCLKEDPLPSLQDLPNLVHLELLQVYDWHTLCFKAKGFQKLKILGLDYFEDLTFVQIEREAISSLEKLIIQRCKQLKSMPSGIEHLTKLKVLEFFDMPEELTEKLKLAEKDEDYQKVAHVPELRYGYWRDGAWDVTSVERSGEEWSSRPQDTMTKRSNLPPCWK
ncbi:disease resistance protein RPM1-like [Rhodamnia argentea]|uniref:Disease resistance protein RPM1-like n=1 Tax=Rhodamnia argentea TaxID=178133 RepID=A0A8B8PKZ9_9MYRT|nr:disease resistance protein RPM1-like [Rhodamnia argentea]